MTQGIMQTTIEAVNAEDQTMKEISGPAKEAITQLWQQAWVPEWVDHLWNS